MHAELFENGTVALIDRLGPDDRDIELQQEGCCQDRCGDVAADRQHDPIELTDRELFEHLESCGVGADDLGQESVQRLHDVLVRVDAEHLGAGVHQLDGERDAEPAEADDGDRVGFSDASRVLPEGEESGHARSFR